MADRISQLTSLLNDDPTNSFLLFAISKEYERLGQVSTAVEWMENLRAKDPEYIGLYYHLGHQYEALGDLNAAKQILEQGISVAKGQNDLHALSELQSALQNIEIELL